MTKRELISSIKTNRANIQSIADTGIISGSLLVDIEKIMEQYKGERFKKPTDEQIVKAAIVFTDGDLEQDRLVDMVSMCCFIIDRLYENGDIMIKSSKEID